MTSDYRRDHILSVKNDEYERLSDAGRTIINNAAAFFEGQADTDDTPTPSAGERVALKRAMARFVIDSGIASVRGWV
jgi:hypothetical protein